MTNRRVTSGRHGLLVAFLVGTLGSSGAVVAHICWLYSDRDSTNPQAWVNTCGDGADGLFPMGSTADQDIVHEHRNWHCTNPVSATEAYGRAFLAFHRQFILDFDNWRLQSGIDRLEIWDPIEGAPVPGNDETASTPFTHCATAVSVANPGVCTMFTSLDNLVSCASDAACSAVGGSCDNVRPAGAICTECKNLPAAFIGSGLDSIASLGEVGYRLDTDIVGVVAGSSVAWHGSYHLGVSQLGCQDVAGFLNTSRDPAFWMAHKKLDELARDWQSRQATDIVIVIDRSGSMDDNCSSVTPPGTESPCAINDAREAARTFANLVLDDRGPGVPQHRIGLVSFATNATVELALTPAAGVVTDNSVDDTPFEIALAGISTGGATSIAAGIREAISTLTSVPDPNPHQAILVLTDGKENTAPCLGGNSPSSCSGPNLTSGEVGDTQIVAIGFGEGAEESNLRDVAERHGGVFVGEPRFCSTSGMRCTSNAMCGGGTCDVDPVSLQKFFVTGFGRVFDEGIAVDPKGTIQPGRQVAAGFEIEICGSDDRLVIVVGREEVEQGPECDLIVELFTPNGDLVDRLAPEVESGHGLRHDFIRVNLPYQGESTGIWSGSVRRPDGSPNDCDPQDFFYSILVKGLGRVDPLVVRPNIVVGRRILATFRISESNRPIGDFDNVDATVTLTRPNGATETHQLFDDGTGGDKLPGNNVWSAEIPDPATELGVYHLRGHFALTKDGCTRVREAEYSIVVEPEPDQCTTVIAGGDIHSSRLRQPQPGDVIRLDDVFCIVNRCGSIDQYAVEISDTMGWLKTVDPQTGELVDLPPGFLSADVEPFGEQCFGRGPEQGNPGGVMSLLVAIPEDALSGDESTILIQVTSTAHDNQAAVDAEATIRVFPPPDCNQNGRDDSADIADGMSRDDNANQIPDECEEQRHFHEEAGTQKPGDCNQDGDLDLSDSICLLSALFLGDPERFPCGNGSHIHPSNVDLLDFNGDAERGFGIDISDAIAHLQFEFLGGPPHVGGTQCQPIVDCPDVDPCIDANG